MSFRRIGEAVTGDSIDIRSAVAQGEKNIDPSEEENMYTTIKLDDIVNGASSAFDATIVIDYLAKGQYLYAALSALSAIPEVGDVVGKKNQEVIEYIDGLFPRSGEDPEVYTDTVPKSDLRHLLSQYDTSNPGNIDQVFDHLAKMSKAIKSGRQRMIDALESWVNNTPVKQEVDTKDAQTQKSLSENVIDFNSFICG